MNIDKNKLRKALKNQRFTQTAFCEVAGLSRGTINAVCRGASCTEATAYKIAEALSLPLYELLEPRGR